MRDIIEQLKEDEGYRGHAYRDTLGFLTIGYGTLIDPIDRDDAELLLRERVRRNRRELDREDWFYALDPVRQGAVLNMAYQLGVAGVLKFRKMIAALEAEDWHEAHDEALDSRWHEQTPARAERIAHTLLTGESP